jgi:hypothetical protein
VAVGTTLAIDAATRAIRAVLTTENNPALREHRDRFLRALIDAEILQLSDASLGPDRRPLQAAVRADVFDGVLRVRSAARMLHILPEGRR